jgi:phage terminase small subunit
MQRVKTRIHSPKRIRDSIKPKVQAALDAGNIQEVIDNLTVRQRRFVEEYLRDFNGAAAVLRAGYNTKHAARLAHEMLAHPGIRAAMDELTIQNAKETTLKPEYVMKKIQSTLERAEAEGNHTAVLRACELMARAMGMFIERQEISGRDGGPIEMETRRVAEQAQEFTNSIRRLADKMELKKAVND